VLHAPTARAEFAVDDLQFADTRPGQMIYRRKSQPDFRLILPADMPPGLAARLPRPSTYGRWIDRLGLGRAAAIFAAIALATIAAVNYVGLPEWVPVSRPLFGVAEPNLELAFPVEEQERRTLPNGTEFFGARIIVTNTARESRPIPPILIVLRDQRERQVYSWVVQPPQSTLAPGEELTINEAVTDVPKSAVFADIGWAPR